MQHAPPLTAPFNVRVRTYLGEPALGSATFPGVQRRCVGCLPTAEVEVSVRVTLACRPWRANKLGGKKTKRKRKEKPFPNPPLSCHSCKHPRTGEVGLVGQWRKHRQEPADVKVQVREGGSKWQRCSLRPLPHTRTYFW